MKQKIARAINRSCDLCGRLITGAVVEAMGIDDKSALITATYCHRVMYRGRWAPDARSPSYCLSKGRGFIDCLLIDKEKTRPSARVIVQRPSGPRGP